MKKIVAICAVILYTSFPAFAVEQTICFSQEDSGSKYAGKPIYVSALGDDAVLNGGKCNGVKLADMNKKGWRLVQVVSGLNNSFGMVFEKGGK